MKAVLFDLDGTLWDACEAMVAPWNRTLKEDFPHVHRTVTLQDIRAMQGKNLAGCAAVTFPDLPPEEGQAIVAAACAAEVAVLAETGGTLYDGLFEVLGELKNDYRLGIVSNCQCGYIEAFMTAHGTAGLFDGFTCEGMTKKSKGENIRLMMEVLGVSEAIYVGDTAGDERAARAAGVPFVHAAYGFGGAEAPDAVIYALRELPAVLADL